MRVKFLHLDPLGGISGDMFAAALLNAFPKHEAAVTAAVWEVAGVACYPAPHRDHVLTGTRFVVSDVGPESQPEASGQVQPNNRRANHGGDHGHHSHTNDMPHTTWRDIRGLIERSSLPPKVRQNAVGIFAQLAAAAGVVHGIEPEAVTFHEVGNADSIADIVAAAWLIDAMGDATWTVGNLPLGGGRVRTAHGVMPVPAPATELLLEGFDRVDDGVAGERVTPTGAAILRFLRCSSRTGQAGRLARCGIGFGTRQLPGMSNVLRVLAFDASGQKATTHRDLAVIGCEVDDQTGEDLATGLDRLRALPGVHDVLQMPVVGKKGRHGAERGLAWRG
jgi:hypothetical protein